MGLLVNWKFLACYITVYNNSCDTGNTAIKKSWNQDKWDFSVEVVLVSDYLKIFLTKNGLCNDKKNNYVFIHFSLDITKWAPKTLLPWSYSNLQLIKIFLPADFLASIVDTS